MVAGSGLSPPCTPEPAHDPIAIAALIAELPELEAKYLAAMKIAEEANKALDVIQNRIDMALLTLKKKAPRGSMWNSMRKPELSAQTLQQLYQHAQGLGRSGSNQLMHQEGGNPPMLDQQNNWVQQ